MGSALRELQVGFWKGTAVKPTLFSPWHGSSYALEVFPPGVRSGVEAV